MSAAKVGKPMGDSPLDPPLSYGISGRKHRRTKGSKGGSTSSLNMTPRTACDMRETLPPLVRTTTSGLSGPPVTDMEAVRSAVNLLQLTSTWDKGGREIREQILEDFIRFNRNKTGPQLERDFGNGASLFLTRLTAWLRLTYLLGRNLGLQFRAISIFISASSGHRFLTEFMEVGGVLTVLETLGLSQVQEPDKAEGLRLLLHVSNAGRRYKEFICESYGVRAVADCLGKTKSEITQDYARNLLVQLGDGNPRFLSQVYKALLSLLTSPASSATTQQMAGQALRRLLPSIKAVHPSIVEATISLLKSVHVQVQYEGCELLRDLIRRKELQDTVLQQLIELLRSGPNDKGPELRKEDTGGLVAAEDLFTGSTIYMHQAHAARLLGSIAATSTDLAERMISMQVVNALLQTIGNVNHAESQRYAANTLLYLSENIACVANALKTLMGLNFYDVFVTKSDTFFRDLTKEQVRYLRRNTVRIRRKDISASRPSTRAATSSTSSSNSSGALESNSSMADEGNDGDEEGFDRDEGGGTREERKDGEDEVEEDEEDNEGKLGKSFPSTMPVGGKLDGRKTLADGETKDKGDILVKEHTKAAPKSTLANLHAPYSVVRTEGSLSGNRFATAAHTNMEERYEQNLTTFKKNQKTKAHIGGSLLPSTTTTKTTTVPAPTASTADPSEKRPFEVILDPKASARFARATDSEIFRKTVKGPESGVDGDALADAKERAAGKDDDFVEETGTTEVESTEDDAENGDAAENEQNDAEASM